MSGEVNRILITFPRGVELTNDDQRDLAEIASRMCRRYEQGAPGRVMWPFGIGSLCTSMPITREDEEAGVPLAFDDSAFHIECSEREDYNWPCAKCGLPQDQHEGLALNPPAGDCEFEPRKRDG